MAASPFVVDPDAPARKARGQARQVPIGDKSSGGQVRSRKKKKTPAEKAAADLNAPAKGTGFKFTDKELAAAKRAAGVPTPKTKPRKRVG